MTQPTRSLLFTYRIVSKYIYVVIDANSVHYIIISQMDDTYKEHFFSRSVFE
jgi:hypothetical protein